MTGDAHALVVAVAGYHHVRPLMPTRDAAGVRDALTSAEVCGFPPGCVTVLEDAAATRAAILAALAELAARAGPRSRVVVYLSGHGGVGPDGVAYFLPVDARADALAVTAIATRALAAALDACAAGEVTIVLDCCRAAAVLAGDGAEVTGPGLADFAPDSLRPLRAPARVVIAASAAGGSAFAARDAPYGQLTGHLLEGLHGAATTDGRDVTVCQLFDYVQQQVVLATRGAQRPLFIAAFERDYPLTRYPRPVAPRPVFTHDVFVSHDRDDRALRAWVATAFVPELVRAGLAVWDLDDLGASAVSGEAIVSSRYTVALFTPGYLRDPLRELATTMALLQAIETRAPRFIPVVRERCELPLAIRTRVGLDLTPQRLMDHRHHLDRLIARLRRPPHGPGGE